MRVRDWVLRAGSMLAVVSCIGFGAGPTNKVLSVTVVPDAANMVVGQSKTFTASVVVEGKASQSVVWSVFPLGVVDIQSDTVSATLTAKSVGTVRLTATSVADSTVKGNATVTVTNH